MKLFGWKAPRDGARPALSRAGVTAFSGDWPQGYEAQVRAGYRDNAVGQRAVRLMAESVGDVPLTASDPALVALVTMRSGGQTLLGDVGAQLLLHGNAYVQLLRDADGGIAELYALRPERVSVEPDASGWPAAYAYRVGGNVTRLSADPVRPQVVHIKAYNPLDDHYGLGCLGAASGAVAVHNAAARWNKALLDNAARPSGALVHEAADGSVLSRDQFDRLRREMEEGFSGAANAGRPMLLEGGLRWQAISLTPAELDFVGTKAAAAREIALAFGVPPMMLGLPGDSTYANYREANRAFFRLSVLPMAGTILDALAQGLRGWFPDAALSVDLDRVAAIAEDRASLWDMVGKADFLTGEEKRAKVGLS
ncbi:phage portal protein [Sphingomonas bacterium]|uniref:phage portal protein n=1 Tax=Sphingomonas bacterium TaxID=1895847 RepID=UPI001575E7DB|nr:phage portal protein [Sphingomonas bacterium]